MSMETIKYVQLDHHEIPHGDFRTVKDEYNVDRGRKLHEKHIKDEPHDTLWYTYFNNHYVYLITTKNGIVKFEFNENNFEGDETALCVVEECVYKYLQLGKTLEEAFELTLLVSI